MSIQKYKIRGKPGLNKGVIQEDAKRFAKDDSLKVEKVDGDFEISTSSRLDDHEHLKLERLCYFRQWSSNQAKRHTSTPPPSDHSTTAASTDRSLPVTLHLSPPPPHASTKRVFCPLLMSQQQLETELQSLVSEPNKIQVRSHVQYNSILNCATFLAYEVLKVPRSGSDLEIKEDFVGVTPLYDPGPDQVVVDIVAVPGLGTKAEMTFRSKTRPNDIWLRDYLPKSVGSARVLLYGYNSRVPGSKSTATYGEMASLLLKSLCRIRYETKSTGRPVILIGHSLGGILIKEMIQALRVDSRTSREDDLYHSCKGFVFFGVPNRGLNNQALTQMSLDQPNSRAINDLLLYQNGSPSQYLRNLQNDFRKACDELRVKFAKAGQSNLPDICVFYETEQTPTKRYDDITGTWIPRGPTIMMVDETSASLSNMSHRSQSINANHSDLVKFESVTDPHFELVRDELQDMVDNITRP